MTQPLSPPAASAAIGLGIHPDWEQALAEALRALPATQPDLVCIFVASSFASYMPAIAARIWAALEAPVVFGASGQGAMFHHMEHEFQPSIAILAINLPGAILTPVRITTLTLENAPDTAAFRRETGVRLDDVNGWIVLANPFRFAIPAMVAALAGSYPGTPIIGGVASPDPLSRQSALLLNGDAIFDGAVAIAIGGPYDLFPIISQATEPIGEAWTITGARGGWIDTISNRPALELIEHLLTRIPNDLRDRTRCNLMVGFAVDEYRSDFQRGDFVVSGITGIDQATGSIATDVSAVAGRTIQFQLRDAATADLDLTLCLDGARLELTRRKPVAAIGFVNAGRGANLFGVSNHDATLVQKKFPGLPSAGLFTSGEIGPAGSGTILTSQCCALGLIVPRQR